MLCALDHVWGAQWERAFGEDVCSRESFRAMHAVRADALAGQRVDMAGSWCGGG